MAQIIKHRRGSLEALSTITGSLQKGEIVIASGSSNLSVTNGSSLVFAVSEDGVVQAVNRVLIGDAIPNVFPASTYNGLLKGVPYYASGSKTLYLLGSDENVVINLEGNILPFSSSVDSRLDVIEASIGSSGSLGTRVINLESSQSYFDNTYSASVDSRLITISSSAWGAYYSASAYSGAFAISLNGLSGSTAGALNDVSGAFATSTSASNAAITELSSSVSSVAGTFSSSVATSFSASDARVTELSASLDSRIDSLETASSTYATTGSNVFYGTQTITGSLYVSANLVVQGSSSLQNITASAVDIGTNIIKLNTATPAVRFGGLQVVDSGSTGGTGSFLWDSVNDRWIYSKPTDGYTSAIMIAGPKNSGSVGDEVGLTVNRITVATGDDHIDNSIMLQSSGKITVEGNLDVIGAVSSSTITGIGNVTTYSSSVNSRLVIVEGVSASSAAALNSLSSSVSSSLNSLSGSTTTALSASIATVNGSITSLSSSVASSINSVSGAFATSTSASNATTTQLSSSVASTINTLSSSVNSRLLVVEGVSASSAAALNSLSSSVSSSLNSLSSSTATSISASNASIVSLSGSEAAVLNSVSGAFATSQATQDNRLTSLETNILSASIFDTFSTSVDSRLDTLEGTGTIQGVGTGNSPSFANLIVAGDLTVNGSLTTVNTNELVIKDKLITLASGSTSGLLADGAGIEIAGANASITYNDGAKAWTANLPFSASAFTGSINLGLEAGNTKRVAFRNTNGNLDLVPTASVAGDLLQWDGLDFIMSNVIDGGLF